MKKKVVFIITLACLLLVSCATAEQFTMHSNVTFGMTVDEVIAMENSAGFAIDEAPYSGNNRPVIYKAKGKVAGVEDCVIYYIFNYDRKLYAVTYALGGTGWKLKDFEPDYSNVETALEKKYGMPSDSLPEFVKSIGFEPKIDYWEWYYHDREEKSLSYSCKSWLIEQEDGSQIVIAHYKDYADYDYFSGKKLHHVVGYQIYSAEEIENELSNLSLEENENEQQLNDDL